MIAHAASHRSTSGQDEIRDTIHLTGLGDRGFRLRRVSQQTGLGYHHSDCGKANRHALNKANSEHAFLLEISSDESKDTVPNAGVAAREQT